MTRHISLLIFAIIGLASAMAAAESRAEPLKRNVLFIAVDDLRPVLGCYGGQAITPNLDRLAESAAVFQHHYVQWPVCGCSRATLMSGQRPDTHGVYSNHNASAIANRPESCPTLPLYFKSHGYTTLSFGKLYHGKGNSPGCGWSQPAWQPPGAWTCYVDFDPSRLKKGQWRPAYEIYDGPDQLHADCQTADAAIKALEQNKDRPFLICAGFYKPHLPFVAPKRYWDLYEDRTITPLEPLTMPEGGIDHAYGYTELWSYGDQRGRMFSDDLRPDQAQTVDLTRAYYASVSHTDAQVGRLLERLDELGLRDNTAVVVWGDHGFHLGDQYRWGKHTQYEADMRSPLMIRLPGIEHQAGPLQPLVETIDIYPSLCEFCRIPVPGHLDGESLIPVLTDSNADGKPAAYSQYHPVPAESRHLMIYSMRTRDHRYIEWRDTREGQRIVGRELYDLRDQPWETRNVAADPPYRPALEACEALIKRGSQRLESSP
jgi:arylsulfatase A-like enzyme